MGSDTSKSEDIRMYCRWVRGVGRGFRDAIREEQRNGYKKIM